MHIMVLSMLSSAAEHTPPSPRRAARSAAGCQMVSAVREPAGGEACGCTAYVPAGRPTATDVLSTGIHGVVGPRPLDGSPVSQVYKPGPRARAHHCPLVSDPSEKFSCREVRSHLYTTPCIWARAPCRSHGTEAATCHSPLHTLHQAHHELVRDARAGLLSQAEGILQLLQCTHATATLPVLLLQLQRADQEAGG